MQKELTTTSTSQTHFLQLKLGLYNLFKFKCTYLQMNPSNIDIYKQQSQNQLKNLLENINYLKIDDIDFEQNFVDTVESIGCVYKGNESNLINYFINIEDGYASFIDQMKSKHRKELRREVRRFYEAFTDVELIYYKKNDDIQPFMTSMTEIHDQSWKKGTLASVDQLDINKLATREHWLGVILYADNKPVSYMHGELEPDGKYLLIENAYCEEQKRLKPGKVIISKIIENHESYGIKKIDFGSGMSTYKKIFCNDSQKIYSALISKPFTKIAFIFQCQKTLDMIYSTIKKLSIKLNIEHRIRSIVRK
ncbi:MAG: GNAT family N-acetyltransferase [Colwellia sp.]|nr:GNAT family N-acetyltransferase [Colwellia sp.]